jgi:hypothetical protein
MNPSETILPQETSSVTASDKTMTASVNYSCQFKLRAKRRPTTKKIEMAG